MKHLVIDLDTSKCVGCGACVIACDDQNDIDIKAGEIPLRQIFEIEHTSSKPYSTSFLSVACMHCEDAPCIKACPSQCICKDETTHLTIYDNTNCIGCHSCALACPYGIPKFNQYGKMYKCDGCNERIKAGLKPSCVKVCPVDALKLVEVDHNPIPANHSLRQQLKSSSK